MKKLKKNPMVKLGGKKVEKKFQNIEIYTYKGREKKKRERNIFLRKKNIQVKKLFRLF